MARLRFYLQSWPEQHTSQHAKHPRHARAPQSCVKAIAHWSFNLEHALIQHMQQQRWHSLSQQPHAALTIISAASGGLVSLDPGRMFSAVAATLPKPTPALIRTLVLWAFEPSVFIGSMLPWTWKATHIYISWLEKHKIACKVLKGEPWFYKPHIVHEHK